MKEARFAWMAALIVGTWACLAGTVRADWSQQYLSPGELNPCYIPLGSQVSITVDEYGHGIAAWRNPDNQWVRLPWAMLKDPGPGGLPNKLTYSLMDPESVNGHLVVGDVRFYSAQRKLQNIMRFNFDPFSPKPFNPGPGTIVLYSSDKDNIVTLADSAPPQRSYKNVAFIFNGVMTYHPDGPTYVGGVPYFSAWPGYVPGYDVTYYFSDVPIVVPVPAAAVLATLGLGLVGWRKRRLGSNLPG